jgi:hypothetical protein
MKKRTIIINIILVILLSVNSCFSQKVINYNYVVNGKSINDKPYLGMELEFSTIRKYYSDSKFKESRLFTGSNKDFIFYNVQNLVWYYKSKNKWNLFFNCQNNQGGKIHLLGNDYQIVFDKEIIIRDIKIYKIVLQPINITITNRLTYFFDANEGVIILKTASGIILIRNDYFKYKLTESEINLL